MSRGERFRLSFFVVSLCIYGVMAVRFITSWVAHSPNVQTARVLGASSTRFPRPTEGPDPNDIFAAVNAERSQAGLPVLVADSELSAAASTRAKDMASRGFYAHKNPEGGYYYDLLTATRFADRYSCENLDLNFTETPGRYVQDWLDSSAGHKDCLLHASTTRAGYAVARFTVADEDQPAYVVVAIHAAD